jgi:ribosomal protein S18 acetylase RimI-like enzyme
LRDGRAGATTGSRIRRFAQAPRNIHARRHARTERRGSVQSFRLRQISAGWPSGGASTIMRFDRARPRHADQARMGEIAIRRAHAGDAAAIAAVHVAAWRETYAGLVPARMLSAFPLARRIRRWRRILTAPDPARESAVFVATLPDRMVVGFGSCGRQPAPDLLAAGFAGEFSALYLLAAQQRRGIGRRLMVLMARDLLARGMQGAALWVLRDNQAARGFYEALGARLVGQRVETVDAHVTGRRARRQDDAILHELAYGWSDLALLAARGAQER